MQFLISSEKQRERRKDQLKLLEKSLKKSMAEAAVEILRLSIDLLRYSSFDYGGVRHQVCKIKLELQSMKSFLREAERYKDGNEGLCTWLTQVMEAALKAEDALDEFLYHLYSVRRNGIKGFFHKTVIFPKEMWTRRQTVQKLKEINHEIKEIAHRSTRYDLSHMKEDRSSRHLYNYAQNLGETAFFVNGSELIGFDEENERLLEWLTDEENHKQRIVVSIVGMGGSGKTTMAARAYSSHVTKRSFDCFAWVSVLQNYSIEDLLRKIIDEFSTARYDFNSAIKSSSKNYKQLVETLTYFLQNKRYVVVLDDVWSNILWKQVTVALPDNQTGSRVIITTRKEDIASYTYGAGSHVLRSKRLSDDEAWALFCNRAFCDEGSLYPPQLEDTARDLVAKCEGLPLAILALGGLMSSKIRTELKWKEVYDSLSWHISNNSLLDEVKTILLLSFKELPYFLKNCFLYCCVFPIGHWVGAGRLIRMWMAEGFLEERKGMSLEDVGKIYLRELISRSLLQVKKHDSFLRPKLCKLHDLMWELACFMSEKDRFLSVCENSQDFRDEMEAHRLSFHAVESTVQPRHNMRYLRSFSAFNVKEGCNLRLDNLLLRFRLLRTLDLIGAPIDCLPKALGKLFNLRYLGLKETKITELPTLVGRLRNLQALDIRMTLIKALPKEIRKLRKLRHLLIYVGADGEGFYIITGLKVPKSIVKLKQLQVVNCLEASSDIVKGLGELTQLRRLELTNLEAEDGKDLCASIEKMTSLHHLLLMAKDENQYLRVEPLYKTPLVLRKVTLVGRLSGVPGWFGSLRNVLHLHLHWSRLASDPIPCISELPVLERLTLVNALGRATKELCFDEGFSRLEDLYLGGFPELVELSISEGVMPNLVRMNLRDCPKLERVPRGLEHLRSMERLYLKSVPEELVGSIKEDERCDHFRVKVIS